MTTKYSHEKHEEEKKAAPAPEKEVDPMKKYQEETLHPKAPPQEEAKEK